MAEFGSKTRRYVEETLREVLARVAQNPAQLGQILDTHELPLIGFTAERMILAANPPAEAFFGYERHALDSQPTDLIVPERFRQPNAPPQLATEDLTTVELPGLNAAGVELPTVWTFGFAPGPEGPIFVLLIRDRRQLTSEFDSLEGRFQAIYQHAIDGIVLTNDESRIVDANPAACALMQRDRADLVGTHVANLLPPHKRDGAPDLLGEFLASGILRGEAELLLPDGRVRRTEFGSVANIAPGLHLTMFRDVEDRRRAEDAQAFLDEASRLLTASLDYDATLAAVARLSVPRIADWAAVDMLQDDLSFRRVAVAHVQAEKLALADELHRKQKPTLHDPSGLGAVVRTGKAELLEVVSEEMLGAAVNNDPELLEQIRALGLVSAMIVPLLARGRAIGAISFVSAESRHRFGKSDLSFAQELARRAGYAVENAMFVRDLKLANQAKDRFLRRAEHLQTTATQLVRADSVNAIVKVFEDDRPASHLGEHGWSLFLRVDDRLELLAVTSALRESAQRWGPLPLSIDTALTEAARTGVPIWIDDFEGFASRYHPTERSVLRPDIGGRAAIPLSVGDKPIGVLGVTFERPHTFDEEERAYLTAIANLWAQALHRARLAEAERNAIERALVAETLATRKKDEFLAMLGHELRNPLAPILTASTLMRMRGHATNRELDILERQGRHLARLVDDLLDISRITSGKLSLTCEPVNVADVLAQALESTMPMFQDGSIRLVPDVVRTGMTVKADSERLVQVVTNVLVNAAKFTPAGKSVHLSSQRSGDDCVIVVRDEGQGVEAQLLPHIFELFAQGQQGPDRRRGGLGLGLAIARNIVAAHGGTIELTSEGTGCGTTVAIRLPLHVVDNASAPAADTPAEVPAVGAHRLLIVDDNEDNAELLADFFKALGYECFVAPDAHQALAITREAVPHAAILDIGLPDLDGYQLAQAILKTFSDRAPKLIALSGYAQQTDRDRALASGFLDHHAKPVDLTKLAATLSGLLSA